jgi:mRNA interferase MazF
MQIAQEIIRIFTDWVKIKIRLHILPKGPYFKEGEIWWASVGQNVGVESNGKNKGFERPVLILKKFNKDMFLAIPVSTKIKEDQYKVIFMNNNKKYSANLSQMRVLDSKRLLRMVAKISGSDFAEVKKIYHEVIK